MKKILFLALHLGFGGVERAIISEANMLVENYEVEIASAYKLYDEPPFKVDPKVKVTYLSETLKPNKEELKEAIRTKNPISIAREAITSIRVLHHRTAKMAEFIKKTDADIIISSRYLYNAVLAKNKKNGVVTVAQEHDHHDGNEKYIKKIVDSLKGIDFFMPVSKELTDFYAERVNTSVCKYIPHSLEYMPTQVSNLKAPVLISVGRLSQEKGFLDLIEIYARVHQKHPEWKLHIVGDGDERSAIESGIKENKLEDSVILHGYQNKEYINGLLADASIYMMSSYRESFGIVLIEAQSFGIPCVAFDSAKGAMEIIENDVNGYLVSNRDFAEMANKVCSMIENDELRAELGAKSRENSLQYSKEVIQKQWIDFIESIC